MQLQPRECDRCSKPVPLEEFCLLRCNHIFHIYCACNFVHNGLPCVKCLEDMIESSEGKTLANVCSSSDGNKQSPFQQSTHYQNGKSVVTIGGIQVSPANLRVLLERKVSIACIGSALPHVTALHFADNGVDCDFLNDQGIIFPQFYEGIGGKMEPSDLVRMGFTTDLMFAPFVTSDFFMKSLSMDYFTMIQFINDLHISHLEQIKITPDELRIMNFNMERLINLGLTLSRAHVIFNTFREMLDMGLSPDLARSQKFNVPCKPNINWPQDIRFMVDWYRNNNVQRLFYR